MNFQQEIGAEVCFAILLNALTRQATLIGKRVAADRDLLELLQISNLSVISDIIVHRILQILTYYTLFCPTRKQLNKSLK